MELTYAELNKENLELLKQIQRGVFPESSFEKGFDLLAKEGPAAFGNVMQTYFIAYADGEPAGMYGLYIPNGVEEHKSIWLGWYGILPAFRGKGVGKKILFDSMEKAKAYTAEYGVLYFRLYTSETVNESAQPLYNKVMTLKEYYKNEEMYSADLLKIGRRMYPGLTEEMFREKASKAVAIFSSALYREHILVPWDSYYMSYMTTVKLEQDTRAGS